MRITQNASYMTIASIAQKVVAFVYFTLIARTLGPEQQGIYSTALTFTTIMVVFIDLGLTNVLIREVAKAKDKAQTYLSTVVAIKIVLGILTYLATVLIVNVVPYDPLLKQLIYVSAITMLFDSFHTTMYGVLRGLGDLRYESIMVFGSQLCTLALGSIFLFYGLPIVFLILAFTIASAVNFLFAFVMMKKHYAVRLIPSFDPEIARLLIRIAIPFALAGLFARVYSYVDSLLLERFLDVRAVGWYSVAYKITYAFQFIPLALVAALYPQLSKYYKENKERLAYIFERGLVYLALAAFPIAFGIAVLARDIILSIFTVAYEPSIMPLQILVISLIFSFIGFPIGACLNACDRQATQTKIVGAVMVVNVLLNILFIPIWGPSGAAVAALIGNILLTVIGYLYIPSIAAISHRYIFKNIGLIALSAAVMAAVVFAVHSSVSYSISIIIGAFVYAAMVIATKVLRPSQLVELRLLLQKK